MAENSEAGSGSGDDGKTGIALMLRILLTCELYQFGDLTPYLV